MKKRMMIMLLVLCGCATAANAQYYIGKTIEEGKNVKYYVKPSPNSDEIFLLNTKNTLYTFGAKDMNLDGTDFGPEQGPLGDLIEKNKIKAIILSYFSPEEIAILARENAELWVDYAIVNHDYNRESIGYAKELKFSFQPNTPLTSIPPDRFYKMEQELLSYVKAKLMFCIKPFNFYVKSSLIQFNKLQ